MSPTSDVVGGEQGHERRIAEEVVEQILDVLPDAFRAWARAG